jgi:hypothetical protein
MAVSCKKFVEDPKSKDLLLQENIFHDDQTASTAINGLYSRMMTNPGYFSNGALTLYPALSADELTATSPNPVSEAFYNNAIPSDLSIVQNDIWRYGYNFIYHANTILEGLEKPNGVSPSLQNQLRGEAKFVRALCYFYLTNLFGDVPLITTTEYTANAKMERTPLDKVYSQIVADLIEAQDMLDSNYPVSGRIRPNKYCCAALLARIYVYQQKWSLAEASSNQVINSGTYTLNSLSNVFMASSNETIFQLLPVSTTINTYEGSIFIPTNTTAKPTYAVASTLANAFEPNDMRKQIWLGSNMISGQIYYYPNKYKVKTGAVKTENNIVLRLAEVYLNRAEARVQQNNIADALLDLNIIRFRAGLTNLTISDKSQLLSAIAQERRIELFCEWGHRWFDLKRTNQATSILGPLKGNSWQATDILYPIPFQEILYNQFLTQNPGY